MNQYTNSSDYKNNQNDEFKLIRDDFPALYHTSTLESGNAQTTLLCFSKINIVLLSLGAIMSAINVSMLTNHSLVLIITHGSTAMLISSIILTFAMELANYEKKWYDGRAIAESIKTLSWRFLMNTEPYKTEINPEERFRQDLHSILRSKPSFAELLGGDTSTKQQITDKMRSIKKASLETRKQIYHINRIQNQKNWYSKKSKENKNSGSLFFWILMGVQLLAIFCSIFILQKPNILVNPTGFFTTISTGILAWIQLKQYRTLAESYGLTTHELGIIESKIEEIKSNDDFSDFVLQAETAISREHTVWKARRINV